MSEIINASFFQDPDMPATVFDPTTFDPNCEPHFGDVRPPEYINPKFAQLAQEIYEIFREIDPPNSCVPRGRIVHVRKPDPLAAVDEIPKQWL